MILVGLVLAVYSAGFFAFYPNAITITDEACYVRQAAAFCRGEVRVPLTHPITGVTADKVVSWYPPGLSAMMTPAVALWGWRGAFVIPWLAVIAVVLVTARWLADQKLNPLFSLVLLGFIPLAVLGRFGMSDVPSGAMVALGLFFFWRGMDGRLKKRSGTVPSEAQWTVPSGPKLLKGDRPQAHKNGLGTVTGGWWWLAAGFVAAAAATLRETNVLLFIPLFIGALIREPRRVWPLVIGGVLGLGCGLWETFLFLGRWCSGRG
jgi:4-amino-4-deoxy-L-arabinose transferase-like glycosyltransferase